MIGCLRTHISKQQITALYFEFETVLKFYNLGAWILEEGFQQLKNGKVEIKNLK